MKQEINTDNNIFIYAFAGSLLFIASIVFVTANIAGLSTLSYAIISIVLGMSSIALLSKAVKNDKERLNRLNP